MKRIQTVLTAILMLVVVCYCFIFYKNPPKKTWEISQVRVLTTEAKPGTELTWVIDLCRFTQKEYVAVNYLRNIATGDAVLINRVDDLKISQGECKSLEQKGSVPFHAGEGESQIFMRLTT